MAAKQIDDAVPFRQIRAQYDSQTITVYQAYSSEIAIAAVAQQKLDASPAFSPTRMTWIKPSWAWMLYRSGYSYKDARQTNILALKLTNKTFEDLLRTAILSHDQEQLKQDRSTRVRVQWDPERTIRLGRLDHRSIQIGIPGALVPQFIAGIVGIEDVTDKARELKRILDEEGGEGITVEELVERGLVPIEGAFEVDAELRGILGMDTQSDGA